jgi:hypothetical protein
MEEHGAEDNSRREAKDPYQYDQEKPIKMYTVSKHSVK